MAGIDDVFERLVVDDGFRAALARDPHAALLEYDLTPAEVALLASRLDDGDGAQRAVEQRTSKSALLAALGMLGGGEGSGDGVGADKTLTVGADETLTVGGNRTEGAPARGPIDEHTKVPAPPAPFVPVPYPNTTEADVAIESLELSAEGIDVDETDAAAVTGSRKFGDITLKRGLTDDGDAVLGDDLATSGADLELPGDAVEDLGDDVVASDGEGGDEPSGQLESGEPGAEEPATEPEAEPEPDALAQVGEQAGDGQADVVTAAGAGARPAGPEQDDDVFEITDAKEVGGMDA